MNLATLDPSLASRIYSVAVATDSGGFTISVSGLMNMINNMGSGALGRGAYLCELLQVIQFINVNYPMNVLAYFQSAQTIPAPTNFAWNAFKEFSESADMPNMNRVVMYGKFEEFGMYHYFNDNYGDQLTTNIIFLVLAAITWLFSKVRNRFSARISSWIFEADAFVRWNFVLNVILPAFLPLLMFAILQFMFTTHFTGYDLFSLIVAAGSLLIGIVAFASMCRFLVAVYKQKSEATDYPDLCSLFEDYKMDSLMNILFYPMVIIRSVILAFILALLQNYPFVQALLSLVLQVLFLVYLLWHMPLVHTKEKIMTVIGDVFALILAIVVLVYAVLDYNEVEDDSLRSGLGNVIIYGNMAIIWCIALFYVLETFSLIWQGLLWIEKKTGFWRKVCRRMNLSKKQKVAALNGSKSKELAENTKGVSHEILPDLSSIPESPDAQNYGNYCISRNS